MKWKYVTLAFALLVALSSAAFAAPVSHPPSPANVLLAQILSAPDSIIPTLGASGAIAGVLGAYLIKYPSNRVRVLVLRFITHMPAAVVLGFWIVLQVLSQAGMPAGESGGVAYLAHIGGFAAGVALILVLARGRPAHRNYRG